MAPLRVAGVDGLEALVGQHLGHSSWHEVTQRQVDLFAEATGDDQWIHVDPERAAAGPFGATVAHGYLTLSLLPALGREVFVVEGLRMGVNYGSDRVRFPAPVRVGARVRVGIEVLDVTRTPAGARVTFRQSVELEGSDRPACVAETVALVVV